MTSSPERLVALEAFGSPESLQARVRGYLVGEPSASCASTTARRHRRLERRAS